MAGREEPVTWLLGNRELLVVLLVAAAWLARKLGLAKERDVSPEKGPDPAAEDERTRRVRDETRRRIAERRGEAVPVPPEEAAPAPMEEEGGVPGETSPEPPPWLQPPSVEEEAGAVLARQRLPGRKMRELESAAPPAPAMAAAAVAPVPSSPPPYAWLAQLQETQGARRAIILREVIGPPVGLRR